MESLAQHYEEKFSLIRQMTELARDTPEEVERVLMEILEERNVMLSSLEALKEEVKSWRNQLATVHRLAQALRETDKKNQELLKNVPTQALRKSVAPPSVESKGDLKTSGGKKGPVGVIQEPRTVMTQSVKHLTVDEFEKVPKYMKGRLTYDSLSVAVEEFNSAVKGKYEFLAKSLNEISLKEKKRRNILKSQDKAELKGKHFVTSDELKEFSMFKTENSKKAVITVLRHFQKIRENRGPGSTIRYVVV